MVAFVEESLPFKQSLLATRLTGIIALFQAYFPCSARQTVLRFRVIQSRENDGVSFEFIDGYKPGLYQLLQYLKNQMK